MGATRVTQRLLVDRALDNLGYQNRAILRLQEQLSTGLAVNRPSDNPLATLRGISSRKRIAETGQYLTNISTMSPYLLETETAIRTVSDVILRSNELVLQAANSTNSQLQFDQIALEINQLLESMLVQANHVSGDRHIFGGTRTLAEPFQTTRDADGEVTAVNYQGNDEHFVFEISEGITVNSNVTGQDAFLPTIPGTVDVFQLMIDIRDTLRSGDIGALEPLLEDINGAQDQLLLAVTRVGAVQARIERVDANLREVEIQLEQVLSDNVDADLAEVIVELNAQSNAFQASLNAAARVIQPSLLDFIR
jgi:flagellar hook-associated protein 3 FlgL